MVSRLLRVLAGNNKKQSTSSAKHSDEAKLKNRPGKKRRSSLPGNVTVQSAKQQVGPHRCSVLEMKPGDQAIILFLATGHDGRPDRLNALGIIPGNSIRLLQKQPSLVVKVDHTEIALDREIAKEIFVRVEN